MNLELPLVPRSQITNGIIGVSFAAGDFGRVDPRMLEQPLPCPSPHEGLTPHTAPDWEKTLREGENKGLGLVLSSQKYEYFIMLLPHQNAAAAYCM